MMHIKMSNSVQLKKTWPYVPFQINKELNLFLSRGYWHVSSLAKWNRNILSLLLSQAAYRDIFFHINTQLESNMSPVMIIWNLSVLKREIWLEVEQIYTTYWIAVTCQSDRGITWHVGLGPLILVTTLLILWAFYLVKKKIKYFWSVAWPHNWSVTWLCGWRRLVLSHHPADCAMFGFHRSR